jgi:hypothetical protein
MNQPTTQWGRRSFPCNGLRRACVSEFPEYQSPEASLTKITMQETQHGQRIYHLVGGFNHLEKYEYSMGSIMPYIIC